MTLILSGTDGLSDVDGSAATPAIRGTDANTGIFFPAADTIAFSEGGAEAMRIDSSGNVGVGTVSPNSRLTIVGSADLSADINSTSATGGYMVWRTSGTVIADLGTAQNCFGTGGTDTFAINGRAARALLFGTNNTERMRIDSNGVVGIGVTPSGAWSSTLVKALQIGDNGASVSSYTTSNTGGKYAFLTANAIYDGVSGSGWKYIGSAAASQYALANDTHYWNIAASGTAGNVITWTQAMTLTSSGNLLVGTTSTEGRLSVKSAGSTSASYHTVFRNSAGASLFVVRDDGRPELPWSYTNTTGSAANVFIDASGILYRSTSSLKYKTDVQNATHGLTEVMSLRPVTYKGKTETDDGKTFGGLIAEEVHEVGLAEFVHYAEDGSPDALNYGNMVSLCIKAIQEQQAIITQLQADVAALKGTA